MSLHRSTCCCTGYEVCCKCEGQDHLTSSCVVDPVTCAPTPPNLYIGNSESACTESTCRGACCKFMRVVFPPQCCPSYPTGEPFVLIDCEDDVEWCVCNKLNYDRDNGATQYADRLNVFHVQQTCEEVNDCQPTLATGCIPTSFVVLYGTVMGEYTNYPCNAGQMLGNGAYVPYIVDTTPSLYPYYDGVTTWQNAASYVQALISGFESQSFSVPGLYKTYTMTIIQSANSGDCFANIDLCDSSASGWTDQYEVFDENGDVCCESLQFSGPQLGYCDTANQWGDCGCANLSGNGTMGSWNVIITPHCAGCAYCGGINGWAYNGVCDVTIPPCGIKCNPNYTMGYINSCTTCGGNAANHYYAQGTDKGYWKSCCQTVTATGC